MTLLDNSLEFRILLTCENTTQGMRKKIPFPRGMKEREFKAHLSLRLVPLPTSQTENIHIYRHRVECSGPKLPPSTRGSQMVVVEGATSMHLSGEFAMTGDIFGCYNWMGMLLVFSG